MKLKPFMLESIDTSKASLKLSDNSQLLIGLSIASASVVIIGAAIAFFIYRRKNTSIDQTASFLFKKPFNSERSYSLKKAKAVKSLSSSGIAGLGLKKSPSPTELRITDPTQKRHFSTFNYLEQEITNSKKISSSIFEKPSNGKIDKIDKDSIKIANKKLHNQWSENKLGKLHFKLKYNYEKQALFVIIVKCTDLSGKNSSTDNLDPYVKLELLSDKEHKVKTRVVRKTCNPVYDEDFTFYEITPDQLDAINLHFIILNFDCYSKDDVIGEVFYQLAHLQFDALEKQISLVQDISPECLTMQTKTRGEILVSLCYQPAANRLTVVVLKARNLWRIDEDASCDPYVKIYLLYNNQRITQKKTHVKKHTTNPVFNESFIFDIPFSEGLQNLSLTFVLLNHNRASKNEMIGKLEISSKSEAYKHLHEVEASPRRQIAEWHQLKE